jgi:hypothetical protein
MKSTLLQLFSSFFFLSFQFNINAQPGYDWAKSFGAISSDKCNAITHDLNGNVFVTGQFQGIINLTTVSGPITFSSLGNQDAYLMAYNAAGEVLWARAIGGTDLDGGTSVATDNDGNVYVTGFFRSEVNFGTVQNPHILEAPGIFTASDIFLAKYSPTGDLIWAHNFGSDANDEGRAIKIGYDGNIYFCGSFGDTANFNTSGGEEILVATNSAADIFMAKFTPNGALIWARAMGGTATNIANGIDVDTQNNVYLTGQFSGTADFDPSLASTSFTAVLSDAFVAKYNSDGQLVWVHGIGSPATDIAHGIAVDIAGNAYITGNFWGTVDFDSGANEMMVSSISESDVFLAKYSPNGDCLWAFAAGGNDSDEGRGLTLDPAGNVYITGAFAGTADFDPSPNTNNVVSNGFFDVYVAKYNTLGEYQWAFGVGSTSSCYGNTITPDFGNKLYVGGSFLLATDFDPSENDGIINSFNTAADGFVAQYSSCNSPAQVFIETICDGDIFEMGGIEFFTSGSYWLLETNEAGCDSIITLHLDFIEINDGINVFNNILTAAQSNAEYQWFNCTVLPVLIEGETSQSYIPNATGYYQVAVTIDDCEVTTDCIPVIITSTNEISNLNQITVFPNPSKDEFRINYTGETPATATLLNIQGKIVSPPVVLQPGTSVMIQHTLAPGLYLLQVSYLEEVRVVKVVVE